MAERLYTFIFIFMKIESFYRICFPIQICFRQEYGIIQQLHNAKTGEGADDFVTYRYVSFEG